MSTMVLGSILQQMRLDLSESEKQELDEEMEKEFGLIGLDWSHCDKLENEWETNRLKVQEIIYDYIKRKRKKKPILIEVSA